jgi:hypothetical protein
MLNYVIIEMEIEEYSPFTSDESSSEEEAPQKKQEVGPLVLT